MSREHLIRDIRDRYRLIGRSFNEVERRHWAAREALRLRRGGIAAVSKALRISPNTINKGIREIATGQAESYSHPTSRIRKPGGGRKSTKVLDCGPDLSCGHVVTVALLSERCSAPVTQRD